MSDWAVWTLPRPVLGYVLLDYPDRFQIRTVALYLARQSTFLRWPLDELLYTMTGGTVASLAELRVELLGREGLTEALRRGELGNLAGAGGSALALLLAL